MSLDRLVALQFVALVTSVTVTVHYCWSSLSSCLIPELTCWWYLDSQAETAACLKAVYIT